MSVEEGNHELGQAMKGKTLNWDKIVLCQSKITMELKRKTELNKEIGGKETKTLYPINSVVFHCFMITCCVFGAIKFYQLKVHCNFSVYLTSCIKYRLILLWHTLLSEIFVVLQGFWKINPAIYFMINIDTSSARKKFLPLWFRFLCCLIHFYRRKFFQLFVFFSYLAIILFMFVLIFLIVPSKVHLMQLEITTII